jgi:hypothetical protein
MHRRLAKVAVVSVLVVGSAAPLPLAAQAAPPLRSGDTVVVAGRQYAAGPLHRALLGGAYRDLWTAPLRVPLLRPDTLGGLTPTGVGGGLQTVSLVIRAGNGREYRFRPVRRRPGGLLHPGLRETLVHDVVQDQISATNPASALVADRILDAAGILHACPRMYVMPDHPFLGEHREHFAGALGFLEERPEVDEERGITFAGAEEIEGTEDFLEEVEKSPSHRPATREYLAARLVDLFLGDWDRHADQWRWARFRGPGDLHVWRPIPRDRDYAMADYEGLLIRLASGAAPQTNRFRGSYRGTIPGLTANATFLDRRLLGELPGSVYDSVAAALRARLTDRVIDEAVGRMPPEYVAVVGGRLRGVLRARRDALPEAARDFHERMAVAPELRGTDERDFLRVERRPGGTVAVRIWAGEEPRGEPYLERVLAPAETREVRVFLHGGDDVAVVEGAGSPILVRVLGGGGDDRLTDGGRGGRTVFHDDRGDNRFVRGPGTVVDRREYRGPELTPEPTARPPRDWGAEQALFAPHASWRPFADLVVGGGPSRTRYGFRRHPWASQQQVRGLWSPSHMRFGAEYVGRFRRTGTDVVTDVLARASGLEARAFYGFGNATARTLDPDEHVVWARELLLAPGVTLPLGEDAALRLGGELRHVDPGVRAGTPAALLRPPGSRTFSTAGARAGATLERVDDPALPTRGFRAAVEGAAFPLVREAGGGDAAGAFGRLDARLAGYLAPLRGGPTLALSAGGARLWGDFPFQYGAFLGGYETLRGHRRDRFAGDASLHGSAELRQVLARVELVSRGDLGVLALADAGRVWYGGESAGGWHTAVGGGVFFHTVDRTATLTYARGERGRFYLGLSLPR